MLFNTAQCLIRAFFNEYYVEIGNTVQKVCILYYSFDPRRDNFLTGMYLLKIKYKQNIMTSEYKKNNKYLVVFSGNATVSTNMHLKQQTFSY